MDVIVDVFFSPEIQGLGNVQSRDFWIENSVVILELQSLTVAIGYPVVKM